MLASLFWSVSPDWEKSFGSYYFRHILSKVLRQKVAKCKNVVTLLSNSYSRDIKIMISGLFPQPASFKEKSRVYDLKSRLDWGEPALTIIDVRDRDAFNQGHIMGAISFPSAELVARAEANLEGERDIYVYSDTDEETADAAARLREVGFERVSEVTGGLGAWKAAEYPVETTSITA